MGGSDLWSRMLPLDHGGAHTTDNDGILRYFMARLLRVGVIHAESSSTQWKCYPSEYPISPSTNSNRSLGVTSTDTKLKSIQLNQL